jgi:hypothetical protein
MNASADSVESELIDLGGIPFSALRSLDADVHGRSLQRLLRQVERPRLNFNGGGGGENPGATRAD